jgi:surface protein
MDMNNKQYFMKNVRIFLLRKKLRQVTLVIIYFLIGSFSYNAQSQTPDTESFVTTWVASDGLISIPAFASDYSYNYNLIWENISNPGVGNGAVSGLIGAYIISGLASTDTYKISISGTYPRLLISYSDRLKIRTIEQWGIIAFQNIEGAFYGCENLTYNATDTPNLSQVNSMSRMFQNCRKFNGNATMNNWNTATIINMEALFAGCDVFNADIIDWDTGAVTNMQQLFHDAKQFNQPIGKWNTANVTTMYYMFSGATSFNQNIGNWNTSKVRSMGFMFQNASAFNQAIGNWNTANVKEMGSMFENASAFNQPIGNWNTSNVNYMDAMFKNASEFNQAIGNWNTANVIVMGSMFENASAFNQAIRSWNTGKVRSFDSMFKGATSFNKYIGSWNTENATIFYSMFEGATAFNKPVGNWNTSKATQMMSMFRGASAFNQNLGSWNLSSIASGRTNGLANLFTNSGLDCGNYSATLIGWADNPATPNTRTPGVSGRTYGTNAVAARNTLTTTKGWTLTGDVAQDAVCVACVPAIITSVPASQAKLAGENLTMTVVATGDITSYQWKKNGMPISGETNASLTLNNLSQADKATYNVDVITNCGTETSEDIVLNIITIGFYVESGASLKVTNGGSLSLTNTKLVNNGTVTSTNGTLTLKGDATTTIEGTGQTQLNHLTIDNSQQNVELRKNISVSGDLTLTSGNLSLVSGNIDFGTTGKIMNETETNRIFGTGGYLLANANLNAPNSTNPANLGAIIKSTANLGETVIKRTHTPLNVRNAGIERVYEITPTNNTNLNASLKLKYFDAELNGNIKNALRAWKSEDNGSTWVYLPSGNDVVGNEIQVSNVPGMGLFTGHVECPQFIINTVAPLCERETLNLGLNPTDDEATYNWTGPNGFNANTAQATRQNLLPTDAGIYTLTAIKNGCTTTATTNVVVNPLPAIPTITADNMEICKGGTVVLSGNCSTAQASFRWLAAKFEGSQTSALPSSNSRTITEPGVYSGLCESKEGCLSDQVSITINQAADCNGQNFIVLTPEKPAICPGQSITMTANGCAGTVTWLGGPTNLTGNTAVFSPGTTTGYLANCSTGGSASFQIVVATTNLAVATNISTGKERFKAVQTLTSNKKVGDANFTPGANVIYEAGGAIILEPGFTAEKWSVFRAEIKTCN